MKADAKTIQSFLPSGDPRGLRLAEITTRIIRLTEIPRTLLPDIFRRPAADEVAIYFLIGDSDSSERAALYVGQTELLGSA